MPCHKQVPESPVAQTINRDDGDDRDLCPYNLLKCIRLGSFWRAVLDICWGRFFYIVWAVLDLGLGRFGDGPFSSIPLHHWWLGYVDRKIFPK